MIIPISETNPAPHRPRDLRPGGRKAGQGRRQPASAASATLDPPKLCGTLTAAMGAARVLRSVIPTAVIFTLNQDRRPAQMDPDQGQQEQES
jgi:hypothetical protein